MPSKYPVEKAFCVSQKGSHRKFKKGDRVVIVPMHPEIAKGTLKSILQQAGMSLEELMQ